MPGALLEMPQERPGVELPLHSPEWSVTHYLGAAKRNCLSGILFGALRL